MIDIVNVGEGLAYVAKDIKELEDYAAYLEEIFPDAQQERVRWDKALGFNVLKVDMGDDATKKDFKDLLDLYARIR